MDIEVKKDAIFIQTLFKNKASQKFIFVEPYTGQEIITTPYEIMAAEYETNRCLNEDGYATLNEFLRFIGATDDQLPEVDVAGWSMDCLAQNGNYWIDFDYVVIKEGDKIKFGIEYALWPCESMRSCYLNEDVDCA